MALSSAISKASRLVSRKRNSPLNQIAEQQVIIANLEAQISDLLNQLESAPPGIQGAIKNQISFIESEIARREGIINELFNTLAEGTVEDGTKSLKDLKEEDINTLFKDPQKLTNYLKGRLKYLNYNINEIRKEIFGFLKNGKVAIDTLIMAAKRIPALAPMLPYLYAIKYRKYIYIGIALFIALLIFIITVAVSFFQEDKVKLAQEFLETQECREGAIESVIGNNTKIGNCAALLISRRIKARFTELTGVDVEQNNDNS